MNATVVQGRQWCEYSQWAVLAASRLLTFSTDPELVATVTDVVGVYLNSLENAVVLCVDEEIPDVSV